MIDRYRSNKEVCIIIGEDIFRPNLYAHRKKEREREKPWDATKESSVVYTILLLIPSVPSWRGKN
jgi:hypothetical protein